MIHHDLPSQLAVGWDRFVEPLREGRFLLEEGKQLLEVLQSNDPPATHLHPDVVRWIWLIPFTLHWYGKDLPDEVNEDDFRKLEEDFYNQVSRWLGEP